MYRLINIDHKPDQHPIVATAPTLTNPYNIQTKHMTYKKVVKVEGFPDVIYDVPGIMVMYTTRIPIPPVLETPR